MIEFEADLEYCTEYEMLDEVVLNDENGTMEPVTFVPKAKAPGDTSDGYHTFDELYEHRTGLLAALCNCFTQHLVDVFELYDAAHVEPMQELSRWVFKSRHHHDGEMHDGFFIVGINCKTCPYPNSPDRWATWHCEDKWWDRFNIPEIDRAPEWDGHTPADAIARLIESFTPQVEERVTRDESGVDE